VFISLSTHSILVDRSYSVSDTNIITLDKNGVPITDYGCKGEIYIGAQRNPLHIAREAIVLYDRYNSTNDQRYLSTFLNNANWLVEHAVSKGNYSVLQYNFPWHPYVSQPPWQSGLAQGRALDVLVKAHQITGNKTYLDTAKSLLDAFLIEVKDGGLTLKGPDDDWWYEEYADNDTGGIESRVLNGMTGSLLDIYNFYEYTQDQTAKFLFDKGIIALKKNLPKFEYIGGQYSTYDALNNTKPAPFDYHLAQTSHLGILYNITGDEEFKTYYDRWTNFKLPENIQKDLKIYDSRNQSSITFTAIPETRSEELTIKNIKNISTGAPEQFRIEGNSGNLTSRFASEEFSYLGKAISVSLLDENKSDTRVEISFIVIQKGLRDEVMVKFVQGDVSEGWQIGNNQYYIKLDHNSSKNVTVEQLFGNEDQYMVIKQVLIDVPGHSCLDSMDFEIDLLGQLDNPL
jgi:heparosan-N-sulfate-glucuronate 5-epimerase